MHVCGNVKGSLTIERGANVVVEGSVDGKVVNRGGRLSIHNRGIAKFANTGGPPKAEVDSVLKINLWAIATNWVALAKGSAVESAAVVKANAYGCGADQVVATLSEVGCKTFFVSSLAEAGASGPAVLLSMSTQRQAGSAFHWKKRQQLQSAIRLIVASLC